jgi:predicted MFS family arabinose efflux permease
MTVTADCLRAALVAVQHATEQWVRTGIFQHGVLIRLKLWTSELPDDREQLAAAIAEMAAKVGTNTGAVINGVALDERAMPSLESLVLYYAKLEPSIFPSA